MLFALSQSRDGRTPGLFSAACPRFSSLTFQRQCEQPACCLTKVVAVKDTPHHRVRGFVGIAQVSDRLGEA